MMKDRFNALSLRLSNVPVDETLNTYIDESYVILRSEYTSDTRHYHTLWHVKYMIEKLDKYFTNLLTPRQKDLIELAIWYHDVIYDINSTNNESHSALVLEIFANALKLENSEIELLVSLVKATTHKEYQTDLSHKVICDLDLYGLSNSEIYFENRDNVRKEFHQATEEQWLLGRKSFIKWMLSKETIFQTGFFQKHYEDSARNNLSSELRYFYA